MVPVKTAAIRFHVYGRVQGVGFRYSAVSRARNLGLCGVIRNLQDGTVEGIAEGNPEGLKLFVVWLEKGPPMATVERLETEACTPRGLYRDFSITI